MRKDKGLNGDLDRIPMIAWIMFLKFLDDQEKLLEAEARLNGVNYVPTIEFPYRWRDWAGKKNKITGAELLSFVDQDKATRPDGTEGLGLLKYLASLAGTAGKDRHDVIAAVFQGVNNRMISGYNFKDVTDAIDEINFGSSEQIHTLAFIYETLLKEVRDSAGDSGEFYTPRPVIKFMVKVVNPQLGETILDPAAGTGGFLVESFEHLKELCKKSEDFDLLQTRTLYGFEAKPMPYLLCQMNMLLHGIEIPEVDPGNALRFRLGEIGEKDRVSIILTNPPYGAAEEQGILGNFPVDKQTSETDLLFLQLIMRKLKRKNDKGEFGRCGIVLPDSTLFSQGAGARIKQELLENFNLHTIVRLPNGVFAPYTPMKTNLLFFDTSKSSEIIWFYEHPLPKDRQDMKNPCYTKSQPLEYSEFEPLIKWWNNRVENENSWKVDAKKIGGPNWDLDIKNPNKKTVKKEIKPEEILQTITQKEENILKIVQDLLQLYKNKE